MKKILFVALALYLVASVAWAENMQVAEGSNFTIVGVGAASDKTPMHSYLIFDAKKQRAYICRFNLLMEEPKWWIQDLSELDKKETLKSGTTALPSGQ